MELAHIGRYEIHSLLGQGGMGTVYEARDPAMDRWVAIKAITVQDTQQRARFQQEVRAAGSLNHPNITTIYDVGEEGNLAYIVMELVEGETLANRLIAPVPWSEAINFLLPICYALAYAHSQRVIHRDVKPANILISTEGQVKLTDFGVARLEAALRRITESGSTVGTPLYTAPEQIRNEKVDGRADIFSVGVVLFEVITGKHPFSGDTLAQVIYRITQPEAANLEPLTPLAPPALVNLVERALQKKAAERFVDATEIAAALKACLEQPETGLPHAFTPYLSGSSSSVTEPILDVVASNLSLSPSEEVLLRAAFAGHDRVYLEREFSSGYSQARVLLATPVRSGGRRLAQMVLKLDTPANIDQEWQAYQDYVKDTLPPVTAHILEEPLHAPDDERALLRYTFAGGLGAVPPESLRTYYAQHSGEEVATLLEKGLFRAFGSKWWLQRQTTDFIVRREYDRLLPVHLILAYQGSAEVTATPRNLVAGKISAHSCSQLEIGQLIQIQNFSVEEVRSEQGEVTCQALPPSGTLTNPIRVRITGLLPGRSEYQLGQVVPSLIGVVTATRHTLLRRLAEPAFPSQDLGQKQLMVGSQPYPNPLYDYESLLDQRISAMTSIIHGDLNLENILVTPTSGVAWLIDFATTREGHNLYDFMRLETQVITKLLTQTRAGPEAVAHMMYELHQPESSVQQVPAEYRKPFVMLIAIRRMVKICMYNRDSWDEYYLGLIITLLGASKFKELDVSARGLALTAAASLRGLIRMPSLPLTPPPAPLPTPQPSPPWPTYIFGAAIVGILIVLIGLVAWSQGWFAPPTSTPSPINTVIAAISSSTATPTFTDTATATPTALPSPTATLCVANGQTTGQAEIHSGPGTDYPTIGSVPAGNSIQVTGQAENNEWYQIADPQGPEGFGWVEIQFVGVLDDCILPPVTPPRTPTPAPPDSPTITVPPTIDSPPTLVATPNMILEDFEAYNTETLRQTFTLNNARDDNNTISIDVVTPDQLTDRGQALGLTYDVQAPAPNNYVGIDRNLPDAQDWSNFHAVRFWVRNDANLKELIFQWEEGLRVGEVWKATVILNPNETRWVEIPLTGQYFEWADWSPSVNGQMELNQIIYYAFFITLDQANQGAIYLDSVELLPKMAPPPTEPPPTPSPTPTPCQDSGFRPAEIFAAVWDDLGRDAGPLCYPLGSAITGRNYARQHFERGFMFWWEAPEERRPIWVIDMPDPSHNQGDTWARYDDQWNDSLPLHPPDCPEAQPPLGPKSGFGLTWCNEAGVKERIGQPLGAEFGSGNEFPTGAVQFFQGGVMVENPADRQIWVLVDGKGWYRFRY